METITHLFKALRKINEKCTSWIYTPYAKIILLLNGAAFGDKLRVNGILKIIVTRRGKVVIGDNLRLNSGNNFNMIGRQQKCIFWVEGKLNIGNNVGMSSSAIICNHEITIGNNVVIGGNTVIYDTDFHSLDPQIRNTPEIDKRNAKSGPVTIMDNVFIGAHSTILKGVTISQNSIIGSCSVVTKNIPPNQIWAGNPAKFIKEV